MFSDCSSAEVGFCLLYVRGLRAYERNQQGHDGRSEESWLAYLSNFLVNIKSILAFGSAMDIPAHHRHDANSHVIPVTLARTSLKVANLDWCSDANQQSDLFHCFC